MLPNRATCAIDAKFTHHERFILRLQLAGPARQGLNTREEFQVTQRLDQVVISAPMEGFHNILLFRT